MTTEVRSADVAVIGSGFGGSIMAMICRRLGRSVILLERGKHPRFAIGESSTPLANLLLEEIAEQFGLAFLAEFSKWGIWQEKHPEIACGLKRGFTFFHHQEGELFQRFPDHRNEFLVAASPCDALADTHWYRPDFDAFLIRKAVELGIDYFEESRIIRVKEEREWLNLQAQRASGLLRVQVRFAIDASGPRGALFRLLNLRERAIDGMPPTQSLFAHFRNVRRCEELDEFRLQNPASGGNWRETAPYPIDDAAVHHVFPKGWFWALAFNNGITSAGVTAADNWAAQAFHSEKNAAWAAVLSRFPALQRAFADAAAVGPFFHQRRVSFLSCSTHSLRWALLPSAAAFVDPLFSTGFPLNLLGIVRLGGLMDRFFESPEWSSRLEQYARATIDEACRVGRLVGTAYQAMKYPRLFNAVTCLYFASLSFEETMRRLKQTSKDNGFLLGGYPAFRNRLDGCLDRIRDQLAQGPLSPGQQLSLEEDIFRVIKPFDVIGISNGETGDQKNAASRSAPNWHPVRLDALLQSAGKLESGAEEIRQMLLRCGFPPESLSHRTQRGLALADACPKG